MKIELTVEEKIINASVEIVKNLLIHPNIPYAISIAGESGCGKTTLSKYLKQVLEKDGLHVLILHQDDYFKLPPQKNHIAREQSIDHVGINEVRLDLLNEHIVYVKNKSLEHITIPVMNWEKDEEQKKVVNINNIQVIIVDGTYTSLLPSVDCKIFIRNSYLYTKQNRINRKREQVTDFIELILEKESTIIQNHLQLANIIVNDEFLIENTKF
ncbi:MAG: zeta toxin family protein [Chitinophagaceae bacterium]|jgi:uridine kinase|nr:zeta toxin family protein [Chitinophagaceae bacterium]